MPVDRGAAQPLYRQLAAELRARIYDGTYPRGSRLPAEPELIAEHGVSRVTVRLALGLLREEGLVEPSRGRGTFVREVAPLRLALARYSGEGEVGPFTAACKAQGIDGRMTVVAVDRLPAEAKIAAQLELDDGAPVVRRVRHALIDGRPVQLQRSYFPAALVDGTPLAEPDFLERGTFAALRAIGRPPARITEEITAGLSTSEEAAVLGAGPVLRVVRLTRDAGTEVLELLYVAASAERSTFLYENLPIERS
jgi:GntR family transcriptional regulator